MSLQYTYSPNIWLSVLSSILMLVLAGFSLRNWKLPGTQPFIFACIFAFLWSIGSIFKFSAQNSDLIIFWHKFIIIWQLPTITAITCFVLDYAKPRKWLTRRNLVLISIVPLISIVTILTNNTHHLFWKDFILNNNGLIPVRGPLAFFFIGYGYLLGVINFAVFIWLLVRSPQNRWPVTIMFIGQIGIRLLYYLDTIAHYQFRIPFTSLGLVLISLTYAIVLFRFRILDPIPLARRAVINQIGIGILVLDNQDKIHTLNPSAERILRLKSKTVRGNPVENFLPIYSELKSTSDDELDFSIKLGEKNGDHVYHITTSALNDWRGIQAGQLILLTDVTEQRKAQTKIIEQQRVLATLRERELLARELHDDLVQVISFIHTQAQTINRLLNKGEQELAQLYLSRLIEVSHNSELDMRESILGMRLSTVDDGLVNTLHKYLDQFENNHRIQTELSYPEDLDFKEIDAMIEIQLLRILQEVLTNIRKHANATRVHIKFSIIDAALCIAVQDDGQGFKIPEESIDPTRHFGLQMMMERAEAIGGTIHMSSQPGAGTQTKVCVPLNGKEVQR